MRGPTEVRVAGPLAPWAPGYIDELAANGYSLSAAADQLRLMAHLSRWLNDRRLEPQGLTPRRVAGFLGDRRRAGYASRLSRRAVAPLLAYLDRLRVVTSTLEPLEPLDELLKRYCRYLRDERGLAEITIQTYRPTARTFLSEYSSNGRIDVRRLTSSEVMSFVLRCCSSRQGGHPSILLPVLRSVLRFLHLEGEIRVPLVDAVPKIAGWRLSALPRALEPVQTARLLASCDRRTALGRRDYAIILLLARLGLRGSEVCGLALGDVSWRRGEIIIHGKGPRVDTLPLPHDIGCAIVAYLQRGRPRFSSRFIFLRDHAPYRELTRHAVSNIVRHACDRAGFPRVCSHRLRHTAASRMLLAGAPLADIAEVLRHRDVATTAIYAKVDRNALREVAQPWPGGAL